MVTSNYITFVRNTWILKHNTSLLPLVPLRITGMQSVVSVPLQPGHTLLPGYHTHCLYVTWRGTGGNSLSAPSLLHLTCLQINISGCRQMTAYSSSYNLKCSNFIQAALCVYLWMGTDADVRACFLGSTEQGWSPRWMETGLPQGETGAAECFPCGRPTLLILHWHNPNSPVR